MLSLKISVLLITVSGYIHPGPIGRTLFVFARLFVSDSFKTIFLHVVLQLTVETIFSIPVGIVPWSGSGLGAGGRLLEGSSCGVGIFLLIRAFGKLQFLEGGNLLVLITVVPLLKVDCRDCLLDLWPGFPLGVCHDLVHVIQCERVRVSCAMTFRRSAGKAALNSCIFKNCVALFMASFFHLVAVSTV